MTAPQDAPRTADDDARWRMAQAQRALRRDNAVDSATLALQQRYGIDRDTAHAAALTVVEDVAAWLRLRTSPSLAGDPFVLAGEWAARLITEPTPSGGVS